MSQQGLSHRVTGNCANLWNKSASFDITPVSESEDGPPSELANPASVFCEEQGGTVKMREDEQGSQYGVYLFDDGSECVEWKYFRGECEPGE